jgi:hypothetical protein
VAYTVPNIPSSGTTFAQMLGLGASAWVDLYISKIAAYAAPSATPTVNVTGSGGTLPTGVYFGKVTYVDSSVNPQGRFGETTPGPEFTFTQTSGAEPVITFADTLPAWASGRNLYLTAAGGGSGSETLAFTGLAGSTYTVTAPPSASTVTPPAVNTTTVQGTAPPSAAPTLSATGGGSSGGNLPAGVIYVKVTETNGIGETTASPEASVTIAAGNIPQITFTTLKTGNTARNAYVGTASGAEVLYATGVTASTLALSAALPTNSFAVGPPTSNTTGLTSISPVPTLGSYAAPAGTPTVVVGSANGGYLPTGTYKGKITYAQYGANSGEAAGETTAGTEFSFTQTAGATPTITFNDGNGPPSSNLYRNLYLTAAGGSSNTEVLAFTGITAATFTLTAAPPTSSVAPPSTNTTTVLSSPIAGPMLPTVACHKLQALRAAKNGRLQDPWNNFAQLLDSFSRGDPMPWSDFIAGVRRLHMVSSVISQMCSEIGTLADANPGHLNPSTTGIGVAKTVRVWP